jgi:hypothetical protein
VVLREDGRSPIPRFKQSLRKLDIHLIEFDLDCPAQLLGHIAGGDTHGYCRGLVLADEILPTVLQPGHGFLWRTNQQNRQSNQFTFENAFDRRGKPRFLFHRESHMQVLRTTSKTLSDFGHIGQHFYT